MSGPLFGGSDCVRVRTDYGQVVAAPRDARAFPLVIRIAHLSDVHFGERFDLGLWKAVKAEIVSFKPQLIVVSGDMVDKPSPVHLLAARCELRAFATLAGAALVTVPGNHDVYDRGLGTWISPRRDWFERIFYNEDTSVAEAAAEQLYGAPPGFNEIYRDLKPRTSGGKAVLRSALRDLPVQSQPLVYCPVDRVMIAALDSNEPRQPVGMATGSVADGELVRLRQELAAVGKAYLIRVAVVHHHVLPIAFSGGERRPERGGIMGRLMAWIRSFEGAEPFMVLHNAGTLLSLLAEHRFDLVLHGHHHVSQFARIELARKDEDSYPIAVLSSGSAALQTGRDDRGNGLNLITVRDNGQIDVECLQYGVSSGPALDRKEGYRLRYPEESLAAVKRRAFARAAERHTLSCQARLQSFEVTERGDLLLEATLDGLRTRAPDHSHRRDHKLTLNADSWFVEELLELDAAYSSPGASLVRGQPDPDRPARAQSSRNFAVRFAADSLRGMGVKYRVCWAVANSVNMTRWECEERSHSQSAEHDWDTGYVGFVVTHPTETLTLKVKLPPGLRFAEPKVRCRRLEGYPAYEIDPNGDLISPEGAAWPVDADMTKHEETALRFELATGAWRLVIERPLVGYFYQIAWRTPGSEPDGPVRAAVLQQRETLLDAAARGEQARSDRYGSAFGVFERLAKDLEKLFGRMIFDEKRSVELYVYDSARVALRPVFSRRSWTAKPMRSDFEVPLGCGIAGVAFQQGRTIPWAKAQVDSPFIKPVEYREQDGNVDVEMRTMLAIPIFHPSQIGVDRPPPWSCLGVVSFGSSSDASRIPALLRPEMSEEDSAILNTARATAHASIAGILDCLERV